MILPHRPPFLFLDRIVVLEPGARGEGEVLVSCEQFSPLFLVEAMAQLAGVTVLGEGAGGGFLAAINHAEIRKNPEPGDVVGVSVKVIKGFGSLTMMEGEARIADFLIADASFTIGAGSL